jgi:hypothetical protein
MITILIGLVPFTSLNHCVELKYFELKKHIFGVCTNVSAITTMGSK